MTSLREVPASAPVLVLGLGNPWMEDDGAGLAALESLRQDYRFGPEVTLVAEATNCMSLVPLVCQAAHLVAVDCCRSGTSPGTVSVFALDTFAGSRSQSASLHEAGLAELLAIVELLGHRPRGVLVGIEPASIREGIDRLSRGVRQALPAVVGKIVEHLRSIGVAARSSNAATLREGPSVSERQETAWLLERGAEASAQSDLRARKAGALIGALASMVDVDDHGIRGNRELLGNAAGIDEPISAVDCV